MHTDDNNEDGIGGGGGGGDGSRSNFITQIRFTSSTSSISSVKSNELFYRRTVHLIDSPEVTQIEDFSIVASHEYSDKRNRSKVGRRSWSSVLVVGTRVTGEEADLYLAKGCPILEFTIIADDDIR
ncbi:hypothetical protein M0802_004518 [Mischocyttarus mexicanus]|nr:hypothetical protein M0802_004518 [Mischocyttarus mexicanus]